MPTTTPHADPGFGVVILGAGLNSLNLTIAFHQEYGLVSTVVCRVPVAMNEKSVTSRTVVLGADASDEAMRDALLMVATEHGTGPQLLMCNADSLVEFIDTYRGELEEHFLIPQISQEQLLRLGDKAEFAEVCATLGISTPRATIVDFSRDVDYEPPPDGYPCVAKASSTAEYGRISFPGKKKVHLLRDEAEHRELLRKLRESGFTGRFLFQELIPGDDTASRSVTAYRSSRGKVTLLCAADVLLEEHTPEALGRPAAMITTSAPELTATAERFLDAVDYTGFANFDVKVDPRTGTEYFLEINPRIGRNNYYVTAAGGRLAHHVIEDQVYGHDLEQHVVTRPVLYSILPILLVQRYLRDKAQRRYVRKLARRSLANPFRYRPEGVWMKAYAHASGANFARKFMRHYPRPTRTGL